MIKLQAIVSEKGYGYIINAVVKNDQHIDPQEKEHINELVLTAFNKNDIRDVILNPEELSKIVSPPPQLERIQYRRNVGK